MCNRNYAMCVRNTPKSVLILIATLIAIICGIIAYFAISSQIAVEIVETKTDKDERKDKEETKAEKEDFELDLHLGKHRQDLEHKRLMEKDRLEHVESKINMILPICAIIVIAICGSILLVFFKDKIPPCKRTGKNPGATRTLETELNPNPIAIPKSRLDEFKQLIKMGYEVNEICEAINKTPSIGFALDRLNMKNAPQIQVIL